MKILCAVDGSEFSSWAVESLGALFHQALKEVVLLHVIDTGDLRRSLKDNGSDVRQIKQVVKAMEGEAKRLLRAFEKKTVLAISQAATRPFVTIRPVLARGHIAETILKQAEKRNPDLIVMGSRGLSDIKGYLLGSSSRKVLAHSPCAVLTVKQPMIANAKAMIAVDGSKASKRAANQIRAWGIPETVSFQVLSVVPSILTDVAPKILSKARVKALTEPFQKRARELAGHYREFLLREGYAVTSKVLAGNPREVIIDCLEKEKADLAVLGSRGLTGSERFQMGSVSEWVAAYAPCSVLVVRPRSG